MSLARYTQERTLARKALTLAGGGHTAAPQPAAAADRAADTAPAVAVPTGEGMSLARYTQERALALKAAARSGEGQTAPESDVVPEAADPAERAAAQILLRLTHDLQTLKGIQSVEAKVAAKRQMLPEYAAWVDGLLAADGAPSGPVADVLPTVMVWTIDVGDWPRALLLANHVLAHDIALPARYARSAPALIAELIAEAAQKAQGLGNRFPLDVLTTVDELTAPPIDMHDQIRAKLMKAIGIEQLELAEAATGDAIRPAAEAALASLRSAQALNDRVGVKDRIKRAEKLLQSLTPPEPAPSPGGDAGESDTAKDTAGDPPAQ